MTLLRCGGLNMRAPYTALGMNSMRELKAAYENGELSTSEEKKAQKILAD